MPERTGGAAPADSRAPDGGGNESEPRARPHTIRKRTSPRVTRNRNRQQAGSDLMRLFPFQQVTGVRGGAPVGSMDPHARLEVRLVTLRVGNVVLVGKQDVGDAAPLFDLSNQQLRPAWRVDEEVTRFPFDEKAIGPVR